MASVKYWVWLSALTKLRPSAKSALLERFGDAEEIFFAPREALDSVEGVSAAEAEELAARDLSRVSEILGACERQGLRIVTLRDAAYPRRLKNIYAPPAVLYVQGRLPELDERAVIALVGTRKATPYGLKMARDLGYGVCRCGGLLASGLTWGIDGAAAEGALLSGGTVIGVLGTPHDQERGRLAREAAVRGAVISEYPPGTPCFKSFFRDRNRITAGLSVGVAVVEAPEKSGALLFAAEANEQGKEIFAVPGNADAPNSAGTLQLLQEGAKPVASAWDILSEFERLYPDSLHRDGEQKLPRRLQPREEKVPEPKEDPPAPPEEKAIDKPEGTGYIDWKAQLAQLNEDQLKIISAIDKNASHIDDIIEATGLGTAKVLAQLTVLEIKGYVRREAGRRVSLNIAKK